MTFAPDGRLFICEQGGRVRAGQERRLAQPFATHLSMRKENAGCSVSHSIQVSPRMDSFTFITRTAFLPIRNRIVRVTAMGDVVVNGK